MGLGKTLDVFALVLNHPRPSSELDEHLIPQPTQHALDVENASEEVDEMRCYCSLNDSAGACVQCDLCGFWQHAECVGVDISVVEDKKVRQNL